MANALRGRSKKGLVLSLVVSDLRHEWLLSLCMVMAVASVLGPLLILFGLKFGTVETLRERLVRDPRNCEIRPMSVHAYSQDWFEALRKRPDVAFVVPYTRQLSASADLYLQGRKEKAVSVDIIPTADGDPLILENNAPVPGDGECLLSSPAAEALEATPGDTLVLVARRIRNGLYENAELSLTVKGVLPVRAGAVKAVFLRLPLLEAVESYKDGMGVPAFGWKGALPRAYPAFSSVALLAKQPLGPELEFRVIHNTGFTAIAPMSAADFFDATGRPVPEGAKAFLLRTKGVPAGAANLEAVGYLLGGKDAELYPLVDELSSTLDMKGNTPAPLRIAPATPFGRALPGLPDHVPWKETFKGAPPPSDLWRVLLVSPELAAASGGEGTLTARLGGNELTFPVRLVPSETVRAGAAMAPIRLLGTMGLLRQRPLTWSGDGNEFLLARQGYSSFRLYASSLEGVTGVKTHLESEGIVVHTEAERIDDVMRLDKYLSLIFWLIALGSLVGGAACLLSNIYAGIERKRRDLAVLRLLGLSGGTFFRFPLYTAGILAASGFVVAMGLFSVIAGVINVLFGSHLQAGESLCRLAWWHPFIAFGLTLGVALFAGAVAARRALMVEPAEALRSE